MLTVGVAGWKAGEGVAALAVLAAVAVMLVAAVVATAVVFGVAPAAFAVLVVAGFGVRLADRVLDL